MCLRYTLCSAWRRWLAGKDRKEKWKNQACFGLELRVTLAWAEAGGWFVVVGRKGLASSRGVKARGVGVVGGDLGANREHQMREKVRS